MTLGRLGTEQAGKDGSAEQEHESDPDQGALWKRSAGVHPMQAAPKVDRGLLDASTELQERCLGSPRSSSPSSRGADSDSVAGLGCVMTVGKRGAASRILTANARTVAAITRRRAHRSLPSRVERPTVAQQRKRDGERSRRDTAPE